MERRFQSRSSTVMFLLAFLAGVMGGCASVPRTPLSEVDQQSARVAGFANVRSWGDGLADAFSSGELLPIAPRQSGRISYLALSGGGSGGAFGAGVLAGWTASGTRPAFDMVSGVSTGALIAPFAYLGSNYNAALIELYTSGIAETLIKPRPIMGIFGAGFWDPAPLRRLVEHFITTDVLVRVAAEHSKGRRLFVITTNLDSQRTVIWDMGAIAAQGGEPAIALFRDILVASASIPGMFPPVMIDVVANGRRYQEMHSDGGATTQVFTAPEALMVSTRINPPVKPSRVDLFIILNNSIDPEFETVENSTFAIAGRAYATLIKAHARSAINITFALTRRTGIEFNLTYVDEYVPYSTTDPFDTAYMRRMFAIGYRKGLSPNGWHKRPPAAKNRM